MEKVGVYTSICEEDRVWIPQYLKEIERLGFPFAIHFDRCSPETKTMKDHPLCVGYSKNDNPEREFEEWDKQKVFNIIRNHGCKRGLAWDVDETWEVDAREKILALVDSPDDYFKIKWVNLWGDKDHIRVDGHFKGGFRCNLYNLDMAWRFDHKITNGPKAVDSTDQSKFLNPVMGHSDLTCIHWGMMTHELRVAHKERWDRIYTKAVGNNPYGFWKGALEYEEYPPVVVPYDHRTYS